MITKLQTQPQEEVTVKQVQDLRAEVGCGVLDAKKLAIILNRQGYLTWGDVHQNSGVYV